VQTRRFKEKVQKDHIRHVRRFAAFLGRSPDSATSEEVRRFQLHMAGPRIGVPTLNSAIAAPRFFFNVTLERPDLVRHLTSVHEPRKAPIVLNQEEVVRLFEAASGLKFKAAFGVAHGAGPRVSEVVALKVSDIDSRRMTLRVEQGKGPRDRCDALAATAGMAAPMGESGAAAGLAVARAEPGQPDVGPPTEPRRARGGAGGRDRRAGVATYVAA
jgi:integrase/recombinase XerD